MTISLRFLALAAISVALFALPHVASAHYKLTAPPTRGLEEEKMTQTPCGGFNDVQSPRTKWKPGTPLGITAYHKNANFTTYVTLKDKPMAVSDFTVVSNTNIANLGAQTVAYPLDQLSADKLKALGLDSQNSLIGKTGTVMTVYDAGDGVLYQCGDVEFVAEAQNPKSSTSSAKSLLGSLVVPLVALFLNMATPLFL